MLRTILVADASATIRKIVELTFTDTEFRVEAACSGSDALARLESLRPDVVLADVAMPEPSGYDVCRAIKDSERPVPVVLLAGTFEPFDLERARDCGADSHLIKPFESGALRDKVRDLLQPAPIPEPVASTGTGEAEVEQALQEVDHPLAEAGEADGGAPAAPSLEQPADESTVEPRESGSEDRRAAATELSPEFVDAVARAVVQRLSQDALREVAWEVVPKLATEIIRERIRELEREDNEG